MRNKLLSLMMLRKRRVLKFVLIAGVCCVILYVSKYQEASSSNKRPPDMYVQTFTNTYKIFKAGREGHRIAVDTQNDQVRSESDKDRDLVEDHNGTKRQKNSGQSGTELIHEYCNSPFSPTTGEEGIIPESYRLRQVHVFTRHGDRTSKHRFPGYVPQMYNCQFSNWYTGSDPYIKQFAQTLDEMEGKQLLKSHFLNWALYPNRDKCGEADLTSRGALQHINLGRHFQRLYMETNAFIDKKRPYGNQLTVKSTGFPRTYKSAVALLYGFLPNFNISFVNIEHSQSSYFCSDKSTYMKSCYCQRGKGLEQHVKRLKSVKNANSSDFFQLRKSLSNLFELDINKLPWLTAIADVFTPPFCHNLSAPCSEKDHTKCADENLIGNIWKEVLERELTQTPDTKTYQINFASLMLYPVLIEISQRMRDLTERRFTQRFVLYSGHDVTISPLLVVLGIHDGKWPPYASRIVIETVESELETGEFFLKFIYNGIDKTRDVIFCKSSTNVDGLCPLKLFQKFVLGEILQKQGFRSISEACASSQIKIKTNEELSKR